MYDDNVICLHRRPHEAALSAGIDQSEAERKKKM